MIPTAEPVGERILANIVTALESISTAHVTASFWNDIRYVYRGQIAYPNIEGHPACVVWVVRNDTSDDLSSQEHSLNTERLEFQVDGWHEGATDVPKELQRLAFDIRTALMLDPERDGTAIHTHITGQRFFYAGDITKPISRVEVDVLVTYRTRVEDLTISN